jgi:hypothetical protein
MKMCVFVKVNINTLEYARRLVKHKLYKKEKMSSKLSLLVGNNIIMSQGWLGFFSF